MPVYLGIPAWQTKFGGLWGYYEAMKNHGAKVLKAIRSLKDFRKGWGVDAMVAEYPILPPISVLENIGHSELWVENNGWLFHFTLYGLVGGGCHWPAVEVQHKNHHHTCFYEPDSFDEPPYKYLDVIWNNWVLRPNEPKWEA